LDAGEFAFRIEGLFVMPDVEGMLQPQRCSFLNELGRESLESRWIDLSRFSVTVPMLVDWSSVREFLEILFCELDLVSFHMHLPVVGQNGGTKKMGVHVGGTMWGTK